MTNCLYLHDSHITKFDFCYAGSCIVVKSVSVIHNRPQWKHIEKTLIAFTSVLYFNQHKSAIKMTLKVL